MRVAWRARCVVAGGWITPPSRGCVVDYPAVVHILALRIPFTRMWTIWTTCTVRSIRCDSNL
jgi:hypothetical protein